MLMMHVVLVAWCRLSWTWLSYRYDAFVRDRGETAHSFNDPTVRATHHAPPDPSNALPVHDARTLSVVLVTADPHGRCRARVEARDQLAAKPG